MKLSHKDDFPGGSDGKASVYNAADPGSIPGLGRSPGEGNGNPLLNKIMSFATTWMDLEIIILSEVKSQRERQIPYDITYMWSLKYDINEPIYETETDIDCPVERGVGDRWTGDLGLADANYYIWNG